MSNFPNDKALAYTSNPGQGGLTVPAVDDSRRLSMETEERPLPEGWVWQFDQTSQHHFYVDIRANPPRAIWDHPLDDPEYIKAHGHDTLASDSESESDKEKGPPRRSPSPSSNPAAESGRGGPPAQKPGFFSKIAGAFTLSEAEKQARAENERMMMQRYYERRQGFQPNLGAQMSGPMYASGSAQAYAPPPMIFSRRGERRAERRARRAIRRGYDPGMGPVGRSPGVIAAPLYGLAGAALMF